MASHRHNGPDPEEQNAGRRMLGYRDDNEEEHGVSVGEADDNEEGAANSRVQPSRLHEEPSQWGEEQ